MCIFSRGVRHVGATRIFAGHRDDGRQSLIYSMEVELAAPTAMVLPLPTPAGVGEDAVTFVSLADYPTIFEDLEQAFPPMFLAAGAPQGRSLNAVAAAPTLVVHRVGAFVASFAPTAADLDRLDHQFRLSDAARAAVTAGRDGWSFAVVQLDSTRREHVHPIALLFPRRDPTVLYVPTTHVHGDAVPATARFDHTVYFQPDPAIAHTVPAQPSHGPIERHVALTRARGLVRGLPTFCQPLHDELVNDDVYVMLPPGVAAGDLRGEGVGWRFEISVRQGFDLQPGNQRRRDDARTVEQHPTAPAHLDAWHRSARGRGGAVAAAVRGWCERFAREHAGALTAITPELPAYYYNGNQLWSDRHAMQIQSGPGTIDFRPWSQRVEFQRVVLGFARVPEVAVADAWRQDLVRAIDSAAA